MISRATLLAVTALSLAHAGCNGRLDPAAGCGSALAYATANGYPTSWAEAGLASTWCAPPTGGLPSAPRSAAFTSVTLVPTCYGYNQVFALYPWTQQSMPQLYFFYDPSTGALVGVSRLDSTFSCVAGIPPALDGGYDPGPCFDGGVRHGCYAGPVDVLDAGSGVDTGVLDAAGVVDASSDR